MAVFDAYIWESLTPQQKSGLNGLSLNTHSVNGAGPISAAAVKDQEATTQGFAASIIEVLAASDSTDGNLRVVFNDTVIEPLAASDTTDADQVVFNASVNEAANATDLSNATDETSAVVSELLAANDISFAGLSPGIFEIVNVTETQSALGIFNASVIEALAAIDSSSGLSSRDITEVANATDSASASVAMNAQVIEVLFADDRERALKEGEVEQLPSGPTRAQHLRFVGLREGYVRVPLGQVAMAEAGELYTAGDAVAYVQGQCARAAAPPECRLPYKNVAHGLVGQAATIEAGTFKAYVFHPAQHATVQLMTGAVGYVYAGTLCPQGIKNPTDDDLATLVLSLTRRRRNSGPEKVRTG